MKNKLLLILIVFSSTIQAQTLYVADSMEAPAAWRGTSTMINSSFVGGLSSAVDNPPNYPMYVSYDSCYMVKGIGLGSSTAEVDTFTYPNLPVTPGRNYEIRFKVASFGLNPGTNTAAGVDGGSDTLEFQYRLAASGWFRDCKIIGSSNSMWSFDGAIGTNAKLAISRNANVTPNIYVSNATNPITNVAIRLSPGSYTTIQIRFISKLNGSGETWMLDDVEVWDITPTLPVELTEFCAMCSGNDIDIKWTTQSELNNDHFLLYKSEDGINYSLLAQIPGAGTTSMTRSYSVLDEDVSGKIIYYKLLQVDYDGNVDTYDAIAVSCRRKGTTLDKIVNSLGQEVDDDYEGFKIYIYK